MRSDLRSGLAAVVTSIVLAALVALGVGFGNAGAAAEETPSAGASTALPSGTVTPSPTTSESPSESPSESSSESSSDSPSATSSTSTGATPSADPTRDPGFDVTDAQLRWGINNESNNAAYFGNNFFSAGRLPDRGANHVVTSSEWQQRDGNVTIEKYSAANRSYQQATWQGRTTDPSGTPITATSGRFSGHQIVWAGGAGRVDPGSGDAVIRWSGSASVVYYSGYSFFYVTDPVLTVTGGSAVLTATLGGYGASRTDTTWVQLPETPVTLADLGTVDLGADGGITVTPKYRGVAVSAPAGAAGQDRSGTDWGSFPQSYVDFQRDTGISSYWYSSGAATDPNKVALPVTVSYAASRPVAVPAPSSTANPADEVTNKAVPAPTSSAATTAPTSTAAAADVAPARLATPPASAPPSVGTAPVALPSAHPIETVLALRPAAAQASASVSWPWIAGAAALLLSALLLSLPAVRSGRRNTHQRRTTHPGA